MKYAKSGIKLKPKTKRTTKKKKVAVPLAIKSYVKSALHRTAETKMSSFVLGLTGFNSGIGLSDYYKLMPVITQGVAQNSRVGSEIKPIKLVIRGYAIYNSYAYINATMLGARMFIFQEKQVKSYGVSPNNINLLDYGGDGVAYTGTALDYIAPHNKDSFHFYADKKHKVLKPYGYTNNITGSQSMTDIESSMYMPFVITLKPGSNGFPTTLKYDNTSGSNQYPTNFAPYWCLGYSNLLNFSPDIVDAQISASFTSTLYYEDA